MRAGERGWIGLAPSPCPAPPPGRWKGCRGPVLAGFTRMLNQAGMCRGKQGNELLIAERPVQKAADQRRQRRPMPCCSSPLPSPVQKGRSSPTKRDAAPRVRSALHRRRPSRRRMPARQAAFSGRPLSCPLSFLLSSLTSLFMQQAEQGSKTLRFSMQCLLLEKRAGGTRVCVSEHIIPFKRNIGWWTHEGQQPEQEHEVAKA